jgi:predicted nucleic acid-binding protein
VHILDTDTLTHLHAGQPRVVQRLREAADPEAGITLITKIELLCVTRLLLHAKKRWSSPEKFWL